jgi:hypothetical protein
VEVIEWDEAHRRDKENQGCWPVPKPDQVKHRCVDDCTAQPEEDSPGCIDPDCPCGLGVALALIYPRVGPKGYLIGEQDILKDGRRELQTPESVLTHIVDINWPHGGEVTLSELRDRGGMDGKLKIYFDRKLKQFPPENLAVGINEFTFRVESHRKKDVEYEPGMLYSDQNPPHLEDNLCVAVFPIDDDLLRGRKTIGDCDLYITLMCDFILDCHDRLVDGEHRKGQTPTGDGRPGGVFQSWFRVIDDEGSKRSRLSA